VDRSGGKYTLSLYLIGPLIARFHALHPGVTVSFLEIAQEDIETMLANDELDIGIAFTPLQPDELDYTPVYEEEKVRRLAIDSLSRCTDSIAAVRRIAVRAQQQRHVVMRHTAVSRKDDRDLGEERRALVLGKPLAGLECDPVSAAYHCHAGGKQRRDAAPGVGDAFAEHGPPVAHALFEGDSHIG
jgi:DNA-binding transcriptional LysR family regulator